MSEKSLLTDLVTSTFNKCKKAPSKIFQMCISGSIMSEEVLSKFNITFTKFQKRCFTVLIGYDNFTYQIWNVHHYKLQWTIRLESCCEVRLFILYFDSCTSSNLSQSAKPHSPASSKMFFAPRRTYVFHSDAAPAIGYAKDKKDIFIDAR